MSLLASVTSAVKPMPPRIVLYGQEKVGKSSFAAHAWSPIFLMSQGETGLLPLIDTGRVPPTAHFPADFQTWDSLTRSVVALRDEPHEHRTIVLDTGNGAEQLCATAVCRERFGNVWADYNTFGRGNELAKVEWANFLRLLDEAREVRRMAVLILHHAKVKTFQNPAGRDFDQYRPEAIDKLWNLTARWADAIVFLGFKVTVNKDGKATGERRYLRTEASSAIVAGTRFGLPAEIVAAPGAPNLWKAFADAMAGAKANGKATQPATQPH